MSLQQSASSVTNSLASSGFKQNQRRKPSGRIIRSTLLNKDARQSQSSSVVCSEQKIQASNLEKDKRTPRPQNVQHFLKDTNGSLEDSVVGNGLHGVSSEKQEKRTRNKDSPDHGSQGEVKFDLSNARSGELKTIGTGCSGYHSLDNGSHKHGGRQGLAHNVKDLDGSSIISKGKLLKKGGSSGYGSHEKQVWVQKPSAGS
ncbi:Regulator of nonsense transcripts UPF3 [Camellia lanceoleosa]|uniref:Regulator of nonsense transcripts UPF3 n=1 Tax=Camellia lanceoleosa TaxID=1840588 RepID=A0ACC0IM99_9ERIC|nr:Regulator of nonsense transcripts UPF3 [Camellia lanceoleosa]